MPDILLVGSVHLAPEGIEADAQGFGRAFFAVLLAGQFLADDLFFHRPSGAYCRRQWRFAPRVP